MLEAQGYQGRIELVDDVFSSQGEPSHFLWKAQGDIRKSLIDRYVNFEAGGQLDFEFLDRTKNSEPEKGIFAFQKIGFKGLDVIDVSLVAYGDYVEGDVLTKCGTEMQSSVPILSGKIMESLKSYVQPSIRIGGRFVSAVRLYSTEPVSHS